MSVVSHASQRLVYGEYRKTKEREGKIQKISRGSPFALDPPGLYLNHPPPSSCRSRVILSAFTSAYSSSFRSGSFRASSFHRLVFRAFLHPRGGTVATLGTHIEDTGEAERGLHSNVLALQCMEWKVNERGTAPGVTTRRSGTRTAQKRER